MNVKRQSHEVIVDDQRRQNDTKFIDNCKQSRHNAFKSYCLQMIEDPLMATVNNGIDPTHT